MRVLENATASYTSTRTFGLMSRCETKGADFKMLYLFTAVSQAQTKKVSAFRKKMVCLVDRTSSIVIRHLST